MRIARVAAAAALLACAPQAFATTEEFDIDPAHTSPGFAVKHLGISTQRGRFEKTTGKIALDRESGSGSIEIAIDTTSVSTGTPQLDRVLKGEDFFDVEKHPRMTFKSHAMEFNGGNPRLAHGEFTLLGVTKPVTLAIDHFGCTRMPFMVRTTCGADVTTTLSRSAFGMSRYGMWIGDEVKITIQIEAVKVEPPPTTQGPGG